MRANLLLPAIAAGLISLTACDLADWGDVERFSSDFHESFPLNADGRLSLESFNGSVEISGWDQNTVDISGTKYGPTQSAADTIRVTFDHYPDTVSIRAERPFEGRNRGVRFVIKAPMGVRLDHVTTSNGGIRIMDGAGPARLKTSNGPIHVENLKGNLNAESSNGRIELVSVSGDVVARTSNGRIQVEGGAGSLDAGTSNGAIRGEVTRDSRDVRASTSNGPIELTLPANFAADVHAHSSNGSITLHLPATTNAHVSAHTSNSSIVSEFEVRAQGELNKHNLNGEIGAGGPLFDLSTSNGGIKLLKM
jgi:Putative adhesin